MNLFCCENSLDPGSGIKHKILPLLNGFNECSLWLSFMNDVKNSEVVNVPLEALIFHGLVVSLWPTNRQSAQSYLMQDTAS